MLLTRLGEGSKMAVTGDLNQADRMSDNGLVDFIKQDQNYKSNYDDSIKDLKSLITLKE